MPVEWQRDETGSVAQVGPLTLHVSYGPDGWWPEVNAAQYDAVQTRNAAETMAEAEARRGLIAGLRALDWPDDAAVRRAKVRYLVQRSTTDYEDAMRAALTAATEISDGQ